MSVDVYLVQEGRNPNPSGSPYLRISISEAVSQLGLSRELEFWTPDQPPRFGQATTIDGMREPRYVVAEIGEVESKSLGLSEGFYLLKMTIAEIRDLKLQLIG